MPEADDHPMHDPTLQILALPGSLRRGSYNLGLARAARELAPPGVEVVVHRLAGVPLYDADVEAEGWPAPVAALRDAIAAADAVLLASPEYNGGYTAVIKNAIDWASRKPNVLDGKPVAVVGASPGGFGTVRGQDQLHHVLAHVGMLQLARPALRVQRAEPLFGPDGELIDEKTRARVADVVAALAAWTRRLGPG